MQTQVKVEKIEEARRLLQSIAQNNLEVQVPINSVIGLLSEAVADDQFSLEELGKLLG